MTAAGLVCASCGTEVSAKAKFRNDRNIDIVQRLPSPGSADQRGGNPLPRRPSIRWPSSSAPQKVSNGQFGSTTSTGCNPGDEPARPHTSAAAAEASNVIRLRKSRLRRT